MQIIDTKKLKSMILVAAIALLGIIIFSIIKFNTRKKESNDETPILQMAPDNIIRSTVFERELKKNNASYYISENGDIVITDKNGRKFLIDENGGLYFIDNGVKTPVTDTDDIKFVSSALDEAADESAYADLIKSSFKEKNKGVDLDEILRREGYNLTAAELVDFLEKKEITPEEFLKMTKDMGFGNAVNAILDPVESTNANDEIHEPKTTSIKAIPQKKRENSSMISVKTPAAKVTNENFAGYDMLKSLQESAYSQQNAQSSKRNFTESFASNTDGYYLSENDIAPGTIIPITLITGVNSDLPGEIIGQVNANIYDTLTGSNLIIPKGSRIMAKYDSQISWGQNRIIIAWTTLIRSDGAVLNLPGFQGTDDMGRTGYTGSVNNHFWDVIKTAGLSSIIDLGAVAVSKMTSDDTINTLLESIAKTTQKTGESLSEKASNRQPTITIEPGQTAKMLVNKKISLPPVKCF